MTDRHTRILIGLMAGIVVLLVALLILVTTEGEGGGLAGSLPATTVEPATSGAPLTTESASAAGEEPLTTEGVPATSDAATTEAPPPPEPPTTTGEPPPPPPAPEPVTGTCAGEESARRLPVGAQDQTLAVDDLDGDGFAETFRIYRDPDIPGHWFARVEFPGGHVSEVLIDGNAGRVVRVLAFGSDRVVLAQTHDDGDGQVRYGFFVVRDCVVRPVRTPEGGDPLSIPVGERWWTGDLVAVDGLLCEADGIVHTKSRPAQSGPYEWTVSSVRYAWDPGTLSLSPGWQFSVVLCCDRPGDDDLIFGSGVFGC